jgi:hypothetical protein
MGMDEIEQLKQDVRDGRINVERLFDVIATLQRQLRAALQRIEELEKQAGSPSPPTSKVGQPFSLRAEEQRQKARANQGNKDKNKNQLTRQTRRGRLCTFDKLKRAERTEKCFPAGVPEEDCQLSHARPVWRLEHGRAVWVAYEIYRGPKSQYGVIAGVLGRSEFAMEIVVEIAYMVYILGLSFDKVCQLLGFLQNLRLGKTQDDALLWRLSQHWQGEFDVLCT